MDRFDIIVIGAGPAGASAAMTAARSGRRVALVDRTDFPRDKLCGGGLTGRSLRYLDDIFGAEMNRDMISTPNGFAFYGHGQELAQLHDAPPMHMTMRRAFDAELQRLAIANGALDYSGSALKLLDNNTVTLANGSQLTGKVIIGADGVKSAVARHLFGRSFNPDTIGFGLEIEAPARPDAPIRIDFGAAQWGYGWAFPKPGSLTVGVGGVLARNRDMKSAMEAYTRQLGLDPAAYKVKGHHLPFGDARRVPGRDNILLAGDAAGLVDPITGEGIAYALHSGQLAAQSALKALNNNQPDTALFYYRHALRPTLRAIRQARLLRRLIFAPAFKDGFVRAFRGSGTLRHEYMRLMAGEIEYPTLMRATLRRLPRLVPNLLKRR